MKTPKLIVVAAFDRNDNGDLIPAFEAIAFETEHRALRAAQALDGQHAGVVAWSRAADPNIGEYGTPTILFQSGYIPDME